VNAPTNNKPSNTCKNICTGIGNVQIDDHAGDFLRRSRPGALDMIRPRAIGWLTVLMLFTCSTLTGCVRRSLTISTEPPGALVFLNDQEIGHSKVSTDFLWYGDYDVTIRKKGYATLATHWNIEPPWYQIIPLDFFAEVLWPGHLHDQHVRHFKLEPATTPTQEELINRAAEARKRAFDPRR
jgi:hypothetical protein